MHFFFCVFFANGLSHAVYFIFILDYGNDVRQKANLSDFLVLIQNGPVCKEDNFNTT